MLRWIVGSSLKFRYIVAAAAAAMMFFGVQQLRGMPVDVFPEFSPPKVEIQTLALGLSGEAAGRGEDRDRLADAS
jgi:Cu/Ag efflux pump CusA